MNKQQIKQGTKLKARFIEPPERRRLPGDKQEAKHDTRWKKGQSGNPAGLWKKGQSGNPKGRPTKEECLTSLLKAEIEKICTFPDKNGKPANRPWKELIVIATMQLAIDGNAAALREVWDRCDGKLKHDVGLNTGPVTLRVVYGEDVIGG